MIDEASVDRRRGNEGNVGTELGKGLLGQQAKESVEFRRKYAAERDQIDAAFALEVFNDDSIVGDDRQRTLFNQHTPQNCGG